MGNDGASPRSAATTPASRVLHELKLSGATLAAAAIVVPSVMSGWTPTWFALLWAALYLALGVAFYVATGVSQDPVSRTWTAVASAAFYAALNISVIVWGQDNATAPWAALTTTFVYLAVQVATLPYLNLEHSWIGPAIVGISGALMALTDMGPVVAFAVVPTLAMMMLLAQRNRNLRIDLDARLSEAETMLFTDPLTGLLNRRGLESSLGELGGETAIIAIFDADRFKLINDTQGHGVGDQALRLIAARLESCLGSAWTIARLGGDEFVAVSTEGAELNSDVTAPFAMPLTDRQGEVAFTISCGVATGVAATNGDRLLSEAGHALRHAKRVGQRVVYSRGKVQNRFDRSVAIGNLADAADRIVPVVQPILDGAGIAGCEMLARWQTDDGTLLEPAQFMDMVIENGLLARLDNEMLEHAVRLAAHLEHDLEADVYVSANIAASHLLDPGLIQTVGGLLDQHNVSAARLMIEITESERLSSDRRWEEGVTGLCELGVKLAIDDFGAGYSSVARLKNLPITHLKLDRSLVQGANGPLGEIIDGISRFCLASNIGVIAEGIETAEDQISMQAANVTSYQGYFFGRPTRVADFLRDLAERSGPTTLNTFATSPISPEQPTDSPVSP